MREQQHFQFLEEHPIQYKKHLKWISPEEVKRFKQIRLGGDQQHMISKLCTQFLNGQEQRIPVSVKSISTPDGERYIVMDGTTRTKAKLEAFGHDPEQKLFICTFQHEYLNYSQDQWEDLQDAANDHEGASPATENDYIDAIQRRFKSGRLENIITEANGGEKLNLNDPANFDTYLNLGADHFMKQIFKNGSKFKKWWKNRIKETISKSNPILKNKRTYTATELKKIINNSSKTDYSNARETANVDWKTPRNGVKLFLLVNNSRITPNLNGSLIHHIKHSKDDYHVIIHYKDVNAVTEKQIQQNRLDAVGEIRGTLEMIDARRLKDISVKVFHVEQIPSDKPGLTEIYDSSKEQTFKKLAKVTKIA